MKRATLYRYQIPLQAGVVLREQELVQREGLLLCLQENQHIGWGEIAPLPHFSKESLAMAEQQVLQWITVWLNQKEGELEQYAPSAAFGISVALAELNEELGKQGNYYTVPLCTDDIEQCDKILNKTNSEQIAKLKIGRKETVIEGKMAEYALQTFPKLQLRLDANQAWSLEQALRFADQILPLHRRRIQFIEEPCSTPELSRQFALETGIAIAWDESAREPDFTVQQEENVAGIVIKPTLTGSLQKCIGLIEKIHNAGMVAVISSSIESSLGLTQLARIAHQYTPNTIAGLDTLKMMPVQLLRQWQGSTLPVVNPDSAFITKIYEKKG